MDPVALIALFDYVGVFVFAVTGALAASRKQLDIVAFCFFAVATGVGGGTLRDLLIGAAPVFWIERPAYLVVAVAAAVLVYFTAHLFYESWSRYRLLLWADAVGMAAYAVMGAEKALAAGASEISAIILGGMTATFGGVIRDILAGEPSVLIRSEIYITAALVGSTAHVVLSATTDAPFWGAAIAAATAAFLVRAGALVYGWRLPVYKSRPGRHPDDPAMRRGNGTRSASED